ncbi:hypothetical protein OTU49_003001 [Cherax quadricarinatus]|uniref:Retinol dehydrogenase 11 n=2 Tax=Cherax quadricarinatus TaxID=27406 RepID=A0AAW0XKY2_CHEQU
MLEEAALVLLVLVVTIRVVYRWRSGRCSSSATLDGKTVIITGASAGIGKETAMDLAGRGARVIMACRNMEKANKVATEIRVATNYRGEVEVRRLDTSDLASVRAFAKKILENEKSLHILINNAGIMGPPRRELTEDGLELTMATNHYGHFLLTNLLLGLLKKSAPGRIINLTSDSHDYVNKLNPDSLNFERDYYSSMTAYGQSKLCNILFTIELTSKLQGTGVTANSVHPGCVSTEIFYKGQVTFFAWLCGKLFYLMGKDAKLGAEPVIYLAVSEEVEGVSGSYFVDCKDTATTELARQRKLAKQLWEASEVDVKLQPDERYY